MTPVHDPGPDLLPGHVLVVQSGGYMVQSRSTLGVWYLVHERSCSCEAGRKGTPCWHRSQVAAFVAAMNARDARPTAPPAVSMLCD